MAKVVQGIGDAIGDVVKGVVNVVKGVADGVGDLARGIADSPLGKAILLAGAVYFGGAALAGGFGSSAAGGGFLSGMGSGVASAAETLSSAWSSTLAGNVGEAASSIGNAWGTAGTAGGTSAQLAADLATTAPSTSMLGGGGDAVGNAANATNLSGAGGDLAANPSMAAQGGYNPGITNPVPSYDAAAAYSGQGAAPTLNGLSGTAPATPPSPYSLSYQAPSQLGMPAPVVPPTAPAGWWASQDPLVKYGMVSAGTQLAGGLISGAGQAKAAQEQRDYEAQMRADALARYNANNGTLLNFSPFAQATPPQPRYYPQPQAAMQPPPGIVSRYMYPTRA